MPRSAAPSRIAQASAVMSERSKRAAGPVAPSLRTMWDKISARVKPGNAAFISARAARNPRPPSERAFLAEHGDIPVRATGSYIGHGMEPQFPMNVALAALALDRGSLFPPRDASGFEKPMSGALEPGRSSPASVIGAAKAWRSSKRRLKENDNGARDKQGRPVVVVTGIGVVTSLGAGKDDNWKKLTAGESGIHTISRFPTEGLKTTSPARSTSSGRAALRARSSRSGWPKSRPKKRSANPASARSFPGPAVHRGAAGRDRMAAAHRDRQDLRRQRHHQLRRLAARQPASDSRISRPLHVRLGGRQSRRQVRHPRLADLAVDGLRLRRDRDPARRRGDPPRRSRCGAVHRHRRLGEHRSRWCASRCCPRSRPRTTRRRPRQSRSRRTATAS